MDIINYLIITGALITIYLGFFVFFNNRRKKTNIVYALISLSVFAWCLAMVFYRVSDSNLIIFWTRFLYLAPVFTAAFFFYFSFIFLKEKDKFSNQGLFAAISIVIISIMVIFTDEVIKEIFIIENGENVIIFGSLYFIYFFYISFFFTYAYINFLRKYFSSEGIARQQIFYVFTGTFLASAIGMTTNLLLPTFGIFSYNWVGQIASISMSGFIAYAIIVHRLMDIKIVLRKYSVFILSLLVIMLPAAPIMIAAKKYFPSMEFLVFAVVLGFAVLVFSSTKAYFYRLANKYFFTSLYDSGRIISEISDNLRMTLEIEKISDCIFKSINKAFHVKSFVILLYDEKKKKYIRQYGVNFDIGKGDYLADNLELHRFFKEKNKIIILEELVNSNQPDGLRQALAIFEKNNASVIAPFSIKDKIIGLFVLGPKESGDMYNNEDLQVLEIIGAQAAIAIENAILFEKTKDFNIELEKEVEKATKDLREVNRTLMKLDGAKSEFISIASHQLRTPLTVIKGYVSMVLERNFGDLSKAEEGALNKVYSSNERLINLVENLLNVSRIESGRLQFDFKLERFEILIDSVIEELRGYAKKKGLRLVYKKPEKPLPKIMYDNEKLRQVLMNLIDNAIKYTKKGAVAISLKKKGDSAEFSVSDSGIGIREEDLPNLFKKFSRGTGTSLIHTEGTGLGLYVARQIIEAHGGKVRVESKGEGKGSLFVVNLPF
jgi:signal transduction histidine kinase